MGANAAKQFLNVETDQEPTLNLHDIQGNVVRGYGRYGFPYARYIFFVVRDECAGRRFVTALTPSVTTAAPWSVDGDVENGLARPNATVNIAFTYAGLKHLGLPRKSLSSFPAEFSMGMKARKDILGDDGASAPEHWDPVWQDDDSLHMMVWINAQDKAALEKHYNEITLSLQATNGGVVQLTGHRGDNGATDLPYQDAAALFDSEGKPTSKEHFGYTDGISNPFFKGTGKNNAFAVGAGKPTDAAPDTLAGWEPLETGEFILGHKDEAQELPEAPMPRLLSYNGTFMVYRKLHENVGSFNNYLKQEAAKNNSPDEEVIAAKFAGRWRNGAPLTSFGTEKEAADYMKQVNTLKQKLRDAKGVIAKKIAEFEFIKTFAKLVAFNYNDDLAGSRCPVGAHARRVNPRGALEFGVKDAYSTPGALVNRRRLMRRGLPYGVSDANGTDQGNHGIIFMSLGASIKRQFEFVQQQWINYGNDFKLANEKDPLLGNHETNAAGEGDGRAMFETEPGSGKAPHFCKGIPRFVETRGGAYFFVPSMTALRMIGKGNIDPT